jgi:hypothetical protein
LAAVVQVEVQLEQVAAVALVDIPLVGLTQQTLVLWVLAARVFLFLTVTRVVQPSTEWFLRAAGILEEEQVVVVLPRRLLVARAVVVLQQPLVLAVRD